MKPPNRCSPDQFAEAIDAHILAHYKKSTHRAQFCYRCQKCNSVIKSELCYVSEHLTVFKNCAGSGRVEQIPIPYCPKCEGNPAPPEDILRSCWHVDYVPSSATLERLGIKDPKFEN